MKAINAHRRTIFSGTHSDYSFSPMVLTLIYFADVLDFWPKLYVYLVKSAISNLFQIFASAKLNIGSEVTISW